MLIGYCRLTMNMEISLDYAHVPYAEMRIGHLRALVEAGNKIKILTGLSKESEKVVKELANGEYKVKDGGYDDSWIKDGIVYDPTGTAKDCKLLIVENSATNWMYGCSYTEKPQIRRVVEIIDSYKGLVVCEQSDPDLPLPLWKMGMCKKGWDVDGNPYRLGKEKGVEDLEDWGWGTKKEMFKDKQYLVLVKSKDIERVIEQMDGTRFGYKRLVEKGLIKVKYIGQAYSTDFVKDFSFNENPEYDLFYVGYPRGREDRFEALMMHGSPLIKRCVCGPWHKEKNAELGDRLIYHYIENKGFMKSWFEMLKTINNSKSSLYLAVGRAMKLGWETSRPFEALFCGNLVFYDKAIKGAGEIFGEYFGLDSSNVNDKMRWLYSLNSVARFDLWCEQLQTIRERNWNWFVKEFNELLKEYKISLISKEVQNNLPKMFKDVNTSYVVDLPQQTEESEEMIAVASKNKETWDHKIRNTTEKFGCFLEYDENDARCGKCAWGRWCLQLTHNLKQLKNGDENITVNGANTASETTIQTVSNSMADTKVIQKVAEPIKVQEKPTLEVIKEGENKIIKIYLDNL